VSNPRNPTDRGADRRGRDRLRAALEANPPATVHTVGELGAILDNMPLVSIGPDGLGGDLQRDETGRPVPKSYVPESRYSDLPVALRDLTDSEQVRDRVYAHDVADVALAHELGTTKHTCTLQAHGRTWLGTGSTFGLAASDALFRLRAYRDSCDERYDAIETDAGEVDDE
jgi:hypothetical protein